MFTPEEDIPLCSGPVWHGTAIGWDRMFDPYVKKLVTDNERFCAIQ